MAAEQSRSLFDSRADTYDASAFHHGLAAAAAALVIEPAGDVLDVGTGTGLALRALRPRRDVRTMSGVDVSDPMLRVARSALPGAAFWKAEAEALPFEFESFDCILCVSALTYVDAERAASEWGRVLRPSGQIVLTAHEADGVTSSRIMRQSARDVGIVFADPNGVAGSRAALKRLAERANTRLAHVERVVDSRPASFTAESFDLQLHYFGSRLRIDDAQRARWLEAFLRRATGVREEEQHVLIARFER